MAVRPAKGAITPDMVFTLVGYLINKELLKGCYEKMEEGKAVGTDLLDKFLGSVYLG